MTKCLTFQVPEGIPRQKLLNYTLHAYPEYRSGVLRSAFEKRDVKVNGSRVGKDAAATGGTQVCIYLPEDKTRSVPVLYRDERMLIIHKPGGIPCVESYPGERTILQLIQQQLALPALPLPVHRLDAPTEGLLILALSEKAQNDLQNAFRLHQIRKSYLCLCKGTPAPSHAVLTACLAKDAKHARVRVSAGELPGSREIITEYTVLKAGETALLRIHLHTGRTHQIRAHLAMIGHPVLGDDQYGDRDFNKAHKASSLKLCSAEIGFETDGPLADLNGRVFSCSPAFLPTDSKGE